MKASHQEHRPLPGRRLRGRAWARLDNAANIFIVTMDETDTKVFRIAAEVDHEVDPALLQKAVDAVFDRYPLYHSVVRRGLFWYYLEESDLRPRVQPDVLVPFAHLYRFDRRELLFRVVHQRQRISLEVFHALSDGTGAWWFFRDLLTEYLRQRSGSVLAATPPGVGGSLAHDSFATYFGRRATTRVPSDAGETEHRMFGAEKAEGRVVQVRGTRTPDRRNRVVEMTLPADRILALARETGVSLTVFLTAVFFEAVRRSSPDLSKAPRVAVSVPVNLRQQFPSESARNFFAVTRLEHTYGRADDDLAVVAASLKAQLGPQVTTGHLQGHVDALLDMERHPIARFIPRVLKDLVLNLVNRANNRTLTLAISGLGRLSLPEDVDDQVAEIFLSVSSPRPQFCVVTHRNWLTIGFTSPFVETDLVAAYARVLQERGIPVRVSATKVTADELEGEL